MERQHDAHVWAWRQHLFALARLSKVSRKMAAARYEAKADKPARFSHRGQSFDTRSDPVADYEIRGGQRAKVGRGREPVFLDGDAEWREFQRLVAKAERLRAEREGVVKRFIPRAEREGLVPEAPAIPRIPLPEPVDRKPRYGSVRKRPAEPRKPGEEQWIAYTKSAGTSRAWVQKPPRGLPKN